MSLLDTALRKRPVLTAYEKTMQDAEMPRCPLCHKPLMQGQNMAVVAAHGMLAMVHETCRTAVEQANR